MGKTKMLFRLFLFNLFVSKIKNLKILNYYFIFPRYAKQEYTEDYIPTIFDAYMIDIDINNKKQKITLW